MDITLKNSFFQECNNIKAANIRDIVLRTLQSVPEYFYEIPSSSSGKYHPTDELGDGGLLIHTLKDVAVARILASMYKLSEYELDLAIAALFLHDGCKSGKTENLGHTQFMHPIFAAHLVTETNPKNKEAKKIAKLISSHMGRWNTSKYEPGKKLPVPKTKLQKFVHLCDYVASRKDFQIKI